MYQYSWQLFRSWSISFTISFNNACRPLTNALFSTKGWHVARVILSGSLLARSNDVPRMTKLMARIVFILLMIYNCLHVVEWSWVNGKLCVGLLNAICFYTDTWPNAQSGMNNRMWRDGVAIYLHLIVLFFGKWKNVGAPCVHMAVSTLLYVAIYFPLHNRIWEYPGGLWQIEGRRAWLGSICYSAKQGRLCVPSLYMVHICALLYLDNKVKCCIID